MTTPFSSCEELGCCTDLQVDFNYRCGSPNVFRTEDISDSFFSRALDDSSTAQVTFAAANTGDLECCEGVQDLRTWCHELAIYRCGALQWSGPITKLTYYPDRVTVDARDVIAWLDVLPLLTGVELEGPIDITEVARRIIVDNFGEDTSAAGCMIFDVRPSGVILEDGYELVGLDEGGDTDTVGAALRALVERGLHFTAIGRKLVLFGETSLSLLGTLTDEDFAGAIAVVEDGADATTLAVVTGNIDMQQASVEGVCGVVGRVVILDDNVINNSDDAEADALALAGRIVAGGYPTPLRIEIPTGATLSPEAPVCLSDLIPGVDIRVISTATCRQATADLRLIAVEVRSDSEDESVQITLADATLVPVI